MGALNAFVMILFIYWQNSAFLQIALSTIYLATLFGTIYYLYIIGMPVLDEPTPPVPTPIEVVVFTDEGEECDDRLGIHYLCSNTSTTPTDYTFVFTGTAEKSADDCLTTWFEKFQHESKPSWSQTTTVRFTTIDDFKINRDLTYNWALQIAPMGGYDGSNLTITNKYIIAGNADPDKNSVNRKNSDAIIKKFQDEGKLVDISSDHMAMMRFQPKLLKKFQDMPEFMEGIVFYAFKLAIARMRYDHPVAAKGVAEGLVNPKKGRGTNYKSVKMIHEILMKTKSDAYHQGHHLFYSKSAINAAKKAAMKYFMDVYGENIAIPADSHDYLCEINVMLHQLNCIALANTDDIRLNDFRGVDPSKEGLFELHPEVFYSDFDIDNIPKLLQPMWNLFKENQNELIPAFNPVYDLFAAFVLVGEMTGDSERKTVSPDEFIEVICDEF